MNRLAHKQHNASQRRQRTRSHIKGSAERPRLSVHVSNMHISAQIINDESGKTLAYATTIGQKTDGTMTTKATWVGEVIAKKALKVKVKQVIFDRGDKKYHGRVKSLADAARAGGLEF